MNTRELIQKSYLKICGGNLFRERAFDRLASEKQDNACENKLERKLRKKV